MTDEKRRETESTVETREVLSELELLLKDFFVAKVKSAENAVSLTFLNGQTFSVTVSEVR